MKQFKSVLIVGAAMAALALPPTFGQGNNLPVDALASASPSPSPVASSTPTPVQVGGRTITTGGTSQIVFPANKNRRWLIIQNHSNETMYLNFNAAASSSGNASVFIVAGAAYECPANYCPTTSVHIVAATTEAPSPPKRAGSSNAVKTAAILGAVVLGIACLAPIYPPGTGIGGKGQLFISRLSPSPTATPSPTPTATPTPTPSGPQFVQQKAGSVASGDLTITLDAPTTAGNALYLCVASVAGDALKSNSITTHPDGVSMEVEKESNGIGVVVQIWRMTNAAEAGPQTSVTIQPDVGLTAIAANLFEISGVNDTGAVNNDKATGEASTDVTTDSGSGPLDASPSDNTLFLACAGWTTNRYSSGPTNGFTRLTPASSVGAMYLESAYLIETPSGAAKSAEWTLSLGINWAAAIVVFGAP